MNLTRLENNMTRETILIAIVVTPYHLIKIHIQLISRNHAENNSHLLLYVFLTTVFLLKHVTQYNL